MVDLVHVIWGDDQGLVSLRKKITLFYVEGPKQVLKDKAIPTVVLRDRDFGLVPETVGDRAEWKHVIPLLKHKAFPIQKRMQVPT
ncbi:hypothetical protein CMI47_11270 [Candidatus Pacearchaeota archaeon]|nr:hypothetical protein [Candidatus Pacearchaeota archaeon]|tara:strand:- start:951 stop:1205 length:255 start_codon:yes stop_codon:yes gene_type:complete